MPTTPVFQTNARYRQPGRWIWRGALLALLLWILADVFVPVQHSIRQFDPAEVARLETAMWRSYYDRQPVLLFGQLRGGLQQQFHAPFWRSVGLAIQATRAAFVFKKGRSQADYERALPILVDYYESIQNLSEDRFNVRQLAASELNWWIVHRQRDRYSYADLADALAQTAAVQYNQQPAVFGRYARQRAEAMRLCDEAGQQAGGATETDWQRIEQALNQAWASLYKEVRR